MKLSIIGCGAIGTTIAKAIGEGIIQNWSLIGVYDKDYEKALKLTTSLGMPKTLVLKDVVELLGNKPDLVIEAASQEAVHEFGEEVLDSGSDLMVMSVGALTDPELLQRLKNMATKRGRKVLVPSGAIAGLDALNALALVGFGELTLRSSKPPEALSGEVGTLYRGPVEEAVRLFPANINVAATLKLVSGKSLNVEIVSDPSLKVNVHEIVAHSRASNLSIKVANVPHPDNPKTSYLAALSAIALLKKLSSPLWLGS